MNVAEVSPFGHWFKHNFTYHYADIECVCFPSARGAVCEAVVPYPANQKRGVRDILRVDKKFRTHGPEDQKEEYHKRSHIEAVYSFLKTQYSLAVNKVRGLRNVASYALCSLLCLVLNREAAENLRRPDKAVSPTYFNT